MKKAVYSSIKKTALLVMQCPGSLLDTQDVEILRKDGPEYLREVQTNIKLKKKPLADLSDSAKKVLLAYIVFLRENLTTNSEDRPNDEDAAMILHGEVFKSNDSKKLDDALLKQLSKLGITIENDDNKGD